MKSLEAKFHIGQVIRHRLFNYRGVVLDADAVFQGSEAWYDRIARSRPPKDKPWYRVLVHGVEHETLCGGVQPVEPASGNPIRHPLLTAFFTDLDDTGYRLRYWHN